MPPEQRILDQLSLSREEYGRIVDLLDREPNQVELGMFGALWSEHCGYKNSRPLLKMFSSEGEHVLTKAGEENAGVVDIGEGLGVAFKIESHNHPSAIEPYEGAATGVGGIVRDIFAMGARPVALLDSLRFGPLQSTGTGLKVRAFGDASGSPPPAAFEPETTPEVAARNRHLFAGAVAGIGGYGNCIGIPTVGGEVSFSPSYSGNPLVNAMCVGIGRIDKLVKARADGPGNLLMLVGADTGRDGIHGATFASVQLDESSEQRRPAVQVGNPFLEKLLMEACLQLTEEHGEWIVGLQDLGAAGLTSSAVECAAKAGTGIIIDVAKVPRREEGMTPYEVMLSESQERMLVIVKPRHEDDVHALFEHWELHVETIGVVTEDGLVRIRDGEVEVARVAAKMLTDAPTYVREGVKPAWLDELQAFDLSTLPDMGAKLEAGGSKLKRNGASSADGSPVGTSANDVLLALLASPAIASKRIVWRQYDHQVGTNTVVGPGSDAAVVRIKGTKKALAISTDGNAAYTHLDPYGGGAIAVAEAARNVACTGAKPIAMTNCLNFGNPEKPEVYYQLKEAIRGMADAARALGIPVVSGNVSLYNESSGEAIWPTPVVGVVGLIDDVERVVPMGFQAEGLSVLLAASRSAALGAVGLAGSEYVRLLHGIVAGRPEIDIEAEARLLHFQLEASSKGALRSAHDVGPGGVAVAIAESCLAHGIGVSGMLPARRAATTLFGEGASQLVLSSSDAHELYRLAEQCEIELIDLGRTGGPRMQLDDIDLSIAELREAYESGLPRALEGVAANV
ncbi:MAG: phosphoribosylformylglycinamidine synthase subunit PurL [Chloroflexota bacterium]|nr:phosphoribosylformylglycinamidine synthase subunit PurL [Chloroflexota bacterium]